MVVLIGPPMPTDHINAYGTNKFLLWHTETPRGPAGGGRAYHGAHITVKKMINAIRIRQIEPIQYCVRIFMGAPHQSRASQHGSRRRPLSPRRNTPRNIGEVGVESSRPWF